MDEEKKDDDKDKILFSTSTNATCSEQFTEFSKNLKRKIGSQTSTDNYNDDSDESNDVHNDSTSDDENSTNDEDFTL